MLSPRTKREQQIVASSINLVAQSVYSMYMGYLTSQKKHHDGIHYTRKNNKDEFGYYFNNNIHEVIIFMKLLKLTSVLELGAGAGLAMNLFEIFGFQAKGFEIEDELIKEYSILFARNRSSIIKKDILTLTKPDFKIDSKPASIIYLWEPFSSSSLQKQFAELLVSKMYKGQYLAYRFESMASHQVLDKEIHEERFISVPSGKFGAVSFFQKL